MNTPLTPMPDDWKQALAVVAHPDDLEYGAASAIARWTGEGRSVAYVMVTDGEAGIDHLPPTQAAVLRRQEQITSAGIVGVDNVTFLGHPDGIVEYGLNLRRAIAREIRRVRPDILITATPARSCRHRFRSPASPPHPACASTRPPPPRSSAWAARRSARPASTVTRAGRPGPAW